jgi:hypothetical protein
MWSDGRSSRCGEALISSTVPVRAQARNSSPKSTSTGGRLPIRRVVGWPMTLTCGFSQAATNRLVISARDCSKCECTEATQMSKPARKSAPQSTEPSAPGPEAGHPGQLEHAGRDLGPQLVEGLDAARLAELGDLGRDRGADAGDRAERLDVEPADVVGPAAHRTGRLLVVPGPEHVAARDLRQLRILKQERSDLVIHA